ncbi:tripartite tricarboxylate transporter substrate binding protein [uncultured Pseudacidovorax sp.]|uniref:Bug family tripartite tricarboxylate transporter substrate binding protein n=1 Tax=uncultured Pseudacidovorax sp. TaxID=679313 RepID=UPI0025EE0771|nr:tripartite tricarboxylate transporter substrate binding protein [uncultured Pseudacidovorax sp.]
MLLTALLPTLLVTPTHAERYPDRPIRLIVPFNAGPGPDFLARVIARRLEDQFGWTLVVENKAGAGGNIGTNEVAKAKPDGYTLLMGHVGALAVNPSIYPKLPFDPKVDFAPVGMVGTAPLALVTGKDSPYRSLADVVAAAKAGKRLSYGYSGTGTISHLGGAILGNAAGIELVNVPYKGASQGLIDLAGGRLDLYMSSVATLAGHVQAGKLHALAVTSAQRFPGLPEVPTVAEQGFPDFDATTWFAIVAPRGTPPERVATLNDALVKVLADPELQAQFRNAGTLPKASTPEALARFRDSEAAHWGRIAKDIGVKPE